jgi:hypothetical protein
MQITRAFSFVLLAMAAGACSSSSSKAAPSGVSFDAPTTASATTVDGRLVYAFTGNLNFSDSSEDVVSFTLHTTPPPNTEIPDATVSLQTPTQKGPIPDVTVGLPADPAGKTGFAPGSASYSISVTSVSGLVSEPLQINVTLQ